VRLGWTLGANRNPCPYPSPTPNQVALYIIGAALHEAASAYFWFHLWPKWKACFWRSLRRLQSWAAADQPVKPKERAEFFRDIVRERPGAAIPTSELLALALPEHQSTPCPLCDRPYMLRKGCPCILGPADPPPGWAPF
jgi:hypothetical protein